VVKFVKQSCYGDVGETMKTEIGYGIRV